MYWHTKLTNYFRNTRKRADRNIAVVAQKIASFRERWLNGKPTKYQSGLSNVWGIKNFCPVRCDGEDDDTISRYQAILSVQAKLMPNVRKGTLIDTAMDKTFPDRRKFLLAQIRTVTEMKHEYPLLFTYEQVRKQFVFCFYL